MRKRPFFSDRRVQKKIFPIPMFLAVSIAFGLFVTMQMLILGNYIDYQNIPVFVQARVVACWLLAAAALTFWSNYQIRHRYQKPIEDFSDAA